MKHILFACSWGKEKEKAWSGTKYSIYMSIKKYYELIEITYNPKIGLDIWFIKNKIKNYIQRILGTYQPDMNILSINHYNNVIKKKKIQKKYVCLSFEECPDIKNIHSYVYQDLCAGYIKYLYYNCSDIFKKSGFQDNSEEVILKREQMQKEFFLNRVAGIFAMGKWYKKWLVDTYNIPEEKVHHVGGGSNLDFSKVDYKSKRGNKILFIGRDFERKNGNLVIAAFKIAQQIRDDIELYIVGPENCPERAKGKNIFFLGSKEYDQLPQIFNMCDVFCMPSKFEAYGLVFAEALIYGLPCIGRNAFEMPYFIDDGETGYLLEREEPEILANYMLDLLCNEMIKKNVRDKFDWYKTEYSWDTVAKRMKEIIEKDKYMS